MAAEEKVSFGYRDVDASEKAGLVKGVFNSVAGRYDLMNDVMSGGLHRLWKSDMAAALDPRPGERFLDVAGGTGDIAFRILDALKKRHGARPGAIQVLDINAEMLAVGRERAAKRGYHDELNWTCGDAQALPLPDKSVDAYTIAFGIRNVTHIGQALKEAYRVLKPGGRFFCLEFSKMALPGLDKVYDEYSFKLIPWFGEKLAGDGESYQYLVESIRKFPDAETFAAMMGEAGLGRAGFRLMTGGVVALHQGWRL